MWVILALLAGQDWTNL